MEKIFNKSLFFVLYLLLFIFPFFFLNLTQEYFVTHKLYLLGFGVLLLVLISTIQILISKKISWKKHGLDNPVLLFLMAMAISIIFSSPNKVQALLNPSFGLIMMVSLAILYFYLSRIQSEIRVGHARPLQLMSIILSLITIIFYFQPLKNINLPQNLIFLKNPAFTPVGGQLDLAIFLGFFVVFAIVNILKKNGKLILNSSLLILNLLALFLTVYSLIKPNAGLINQTPTLVLPPFRLSWFAALEVLKTPQTALMGIGLDNFCSIFTRVKDFVYNQSPLWQINSFNVSRSAVLQILTETGIFGLLSFGLLIFSIFKSVMKQWNNETIKPSIFLFLYLFICLFIFPLPLSSGFFFFVILPNFPQ